MCIYLHIGARWRRGARPVAGPGPTGPEARVRGGRVLLIRSNRYNKVLPASKRGEGTAD